jgi:hypothetical protein
MPLTKIYYVLDEGCFASRTLELSLCEFHMSEMLLSISVLKFVLIPAGNTQNT